LKKDEIEPVGESADKESRRVSAEITRAYVAGKWVEWAKTKIEMYEFLSLTDEQGNALNNGKRVYTEVTKIQCTWPLSTETTLTHIILNYKGPAISSESIIFVFIFPDRYATSSIIFNAKKADTQLGGVEGGVEGQMLQCIGLPQFNGITKWTEGGQWAKELGEVCQRFHENQLDEIGKKQTQGGVTKEEQENYRKGLKIPIERMQNEYRKEEINQKTASGLIVEMREGVGQVVHPARVNL
jgi:hypothetical protein